MHIHASTPCGSGSPLRNFNPDSVTEKDQEWDEIINAIGGYFKHADSCSFELPERNTIWSRPETVNLLESFDMRHEALVRLCKTGCQNKDGIPIGKTLKFVSNSAWFALNLHSKLSTCTCQTHAELYQINYTETAFYNRKLARYILIAVKHASKKSCCDRERDRSWIHVLFHFRFIFLFARCFQTNVAKDKQEVLLCFIFVQSFVARCCEMQCVCAAQNHLKGY